eukprot:751497-Pleurochrysis_carterae.AAC.1
MSARKSRTSAAVVAAELQEANVVDAIAWPARLDSGRANGLATLVLCNVSPAETFQSRRSCRLQTRLRRCRMPCRCALRQRDGHHES